VIRFLRHLTLGCLALCVLSGMLGFLWYRYEINRDPMPLLERGPAVYRVLREETLEVTTQSGELRLFREMLLDGGLAGHVQFTVSLPKASKGKRLPTLVMLGGVEIGQASLGYIPTHGHNALVAYQYPGSREPWYEGSLVRKLPAFHRAVLEVPAQVDVLLAWVVAQPWCEKAQVSLLGYSFGAIFLPSVQRLAKAHGRPLGPTVLAYGGADIPELLMANLELRPRWLRRFLAEGLAAWVRPVEPALHLPHLQGEFLFINGKRDLQIPAACALKMQTLAPEPKSVVWLEAGHMNPDNPALLLEIIRISRTWMIQRKAMAE
jgi:pimeloyl-ACP methyl ester carboxylesterase